METVESRSDETEGWTRTCEENDKVFDVADSHELLLVVDEERHARCVDHVRAEVEDSVPACEENHTDTPDELGNIQGKHVDEQAEEPVEGDIREGNVTIRKVIGEFRQLLREKIREDAFIHAHSKLRKRKTTNIQAHR